MTNSIEVDITEAEVSFVIMLPGPIQHPGMHMPSKGYAILEDPTWKVARETYAELVSRIGLALPPLNAYFCSGALGMDNPQFGRWSGS